MASEDYRIVNVRSTIIVIILNQFLDNEEILNQRLLEREDLKGIAVTTVT
jgi:hypothetical protein